MSNPWRATIGGIDPGTGADGEEMRRRSLAAAQSS
jgi:hypothetical protein